MDFLPNNFLKYFFLNFILILAQSTESSSDNSPFDPAKEANNLKNAFISSTEEGLSYMDKLASTIASKNRLEIKKAYDGSLADDMGCASDNYHCKLLLALFSELLENYVYYFKAASFVDELISKNNLLHEIIMISTSETSDMQENFLDTYKDKKQEHPLAAMPFDGDALNFCEEVIVKKRRLSDMETLDNAKAEADAIELMKEMEHWEDHREMLDTVMITLPFKQYNVTIYEFERRINDKLINIIENTLHDKRLIELYKLMNTFNQSRVDFYCSQLYAAIQLAKQDINNDVSLDTLSLIVATRSGNDLSSILKLFPRKYDGQTLPDLIKEIIGDNKCGNLLLKVCSAEENK